MNAVIYARYSTSVKNPSRVRFVNAQPMPKETASQWSGTTLTVHFLPKRIIDRISSK